MQSINCLTDCLNFLKNTQTTVTVALVCPYDESSQEVIAEATRLGFARFILVGEPQRMPAAEADVEIVAADSDDDAAARAVALVRSGCADVLMKGLLNTDNFLRAILNKENGLLPRGQVLSHITASEIPDRDSLLFYTDVAVIPYPTLEQRRAMVGYIARLCRSFGMPEPRIALIHCTEKTSPKFPVTLDYVEIKSEAAAGEFGAVTVDGPMDVKSALDAHSAKVKGIESAVTGHADALIFPDIQAGNTFYKSVSYFAHALNAGMLVGASAPIVLPSRADSGRSKLFSLAMAAVWTANA